MNPLKCKNKVYPSGMWGSFQGHQCHRNIWKNGYCKTHHPDTVKVRDETRKEIWKQKQENNPILLLQKANERIKELESELELFKAGLERG